ncbi:hypothetical protein GCM10009789_02990 [Kribbella sancticallisti]|uniref:VOC domain-containing protein n=1 Tax=Kribbella sancticallisti TaxID=460087 RepID=A0ABP4N1N2_9ACTN
MPNVLTHFEIFADDAAALAGFYRSLFDWKIEKAAGVDYFTIDTGSDGVSQLSGGLTLRAIPEPRSWVHYVSVESLDDTLVRVTELGGSVVREKTAIPRTAWYAVVADPQGNVFALWQSDPDAFPVLRPEL